MDLDLVWDIDKYVYEEAVAILGINARIKVEFRTAFHDQAKSDTHATSMRSHQSL